MEKRLNSKIEEYTKTFKDEIRDKAMALGFDDTHKVAELVGFIYDYNRFTLQKDDLIKRKRVKNSIPELNRCIAKRANGEQCTRRRRDDCEFCDSSHCGIPCRLLEVMGDEDCYTLVDNQFVNLDGRLPNCPMNKIGGK